MILATILLFVLFRLQKKESVKALIYSATIICGIYYGLTELLSIWNDVTMKSLLFIWGAIDAVLIFLIAERCRKDRTFSDRFRTEFDEKIRKMISNRFCLFLIVITVLFVLIMLCLACNIIPYNWDSMAYHCSRIFYWAQNKSIAHFATSDTRMLGSPVLAEFINLYIYILYAHDCDTLLNLLQCVSYFINIYMVCRISEKIGCNRRYVILSGLLFAATPIAFSEALSTLVDEFASIWMLFFCYMILDLVQNRANLNLNRYGVGRILILGVIAGLGFLAKPSVVVGMAVFGFWMLLVCVSEKESIKKTIVWVVGCGITALLVIIPEIARNIVTYHAISDPWQGKGQLVSSFDPRLIYINLLKNVCANLPSVFWSYLNPVLNKIVYWTAYILHVDADNIAISEHAKPFTLYTPPEYSYDKAINPVVTVLVLICILTAVIMFFRHKTSPKDVHHKVGFSVAAFISFFAICAIAKWEAYITRYFVSYFAIVCPAIVLQFQKMTTVSQKRTNEFRSGIILGIVGFMCFSELMGLLYYHYEHTYNKGNWNERAQAYYVINSDSYTDNYQKIEKFFSDKTFDRIGIYDTPGVYEYPVLKMLDGRSHSIEHICVENASSKYEDANYVPDVIVAITEDPSLLPTGQEYVCHGKKYTKIYQLSKTCSIILP